MTLQDLRQAINQIDLSLLELIGERLILCKEVAALKDEIEDAARERELQELWLDKAQSIGLSTEAALAILTELLIESKRVQHDLSQDA